MPTRKNEMADSLYSCKLNYPAYFVLVILKNFSFCDDERHKSL